MTAKPHYHVFAMQAGCLPESNEVYELRKQADEACKETMEQWREGWPESTHTGSAKFGYTFYKRPGNNVVPVYIYTEACSQESCLAELEPDYAEAN